MGFGCVLIGASLVFGGHDHDHDLDSDHDLDVDHHADLDHNHGTIDTVSAGSDAIWLPFLSMRFWTFATATFGLTGLMLTLGGVQEPLTGGVSATLGVVLGWAVARFFRALKTDSVSALVDATQLAGEEARVLLPISTEGTGKVVVETLGGRFELPATTLDTRDITRNSRVLVISVEDGVAQVSALSPAQKPKQASEELQ